MLISAALGFLLFVQNANAQTIRTVGGTGASYSTLKMAFDAINAGTITGAVTLQITGSTTETATAALNASGTGSAIYTAVTIYPTVSGKTISGNLATVLINLNGADNVTIDGRVNATGSSTDLTITNTNTGAGATSTIRFINDASFNAVRYCYLKGSQTNAASGIIFFSTATVSGNDNNTIENNNITNSADANRLRNAIYSSGTVSKENSGNSIINNNIYDYIKAGSNSFGVNIESYSTQWSITGNSFYETTLFSPVSWTASFYGGIRINNSTGNNFLIENNFIGGMEALCSGNSWSVYLTTNSVFYGIYLNVGSATASSVQQNTIRNFQWKSRGTTPWYGIYIASGKVNIGTVNGNIIGASTGNGSVTIENENANAISYGMFVDGSGLVNIANNFIGSFTLKNEISKSHDFYAIFRKGTGSATIDYNLIGSLTTGSSIDANTASNGNSQSVYGIYNSASGVISMYGNTIANLGNAFTGTSTVSQTAGIVSISGTNTISNNFISNLSNASPQSNYKETASVVGISFTNTISGQTIAGNTICNLSNTTTLSTFEGGVIGLFYNGAVSGINNISNNYIFNLSGSSGSANARIYGIQNFDGAATWFNNIINLGNNVPSGCYIFGISDDGSDACDVYDNTIYIGGNAPSVSSPTFSMISANTNTRNYRNNICCNTRSGGSAGTHYAICLAKTNNLTINYNNYYISGVGGTLGGEGNVYYRVNKTTLSEWKSFTGQDINSLAIDPGFANTGGILAQDYIPSSRQ
ncbi:MAG: hypothetical protein NTW16_07580 [Bacteroidetes bacterium]|nr:hypothetical protein [Bacteroidota bacterium]